MKKVFFLDTNVLIHDPDCIFKFKDNDVIIPIFVIEELDNLKQRNDVVGFNSRKASRNIDSLRQFGFLMDWVDLSNGGRFKIELNGHSNSDAGKTDNKLLNVVINYAKKIERNVILISKDLNLRIKASAHGICSQDYTNDVIDLTTFYTGYVDFLLDSNNQTFLQDNKYILDDVLPFTPNPNEYVIFKNSINTSQVVPCRYIKSKRMLSMVQWNSKPIWGIHCINMEQRMAMDLLLDQSVKVVTLVGKAGSGKTLLSLLSGLYQVLDRDLYKKIVVMRPTIPFSRDIGFLPGSIDDKIYPQMKPIHDNLDFIFSSNFQSTYSYEYLFNSKIIVAEPLTFIRGRSFIDSFIIIDEAQGLTKSEIKTILTRVGRGSKIVFTGDPDPDQIDHPYLSLESSGLTILVHKIKHKEISGHVFLKKSERSEISELGTEL